MHLGAFLVLVGVILAALSVFLTLPSSERPRLYAAPLLAAGVLCIGIGILIGRTTVS